MEYIKLSNGKEVEVYKGCILEDKHNVFIICKEDSHYRVLNMDNGQLDENEYLCIKDMGLDYYFDRIVYSGVVEPYPYKYIDINE
ncbi:MAG: hypothetical protein E6356_13995 [Terrisporobacter othiniensis]|nr:hypothetical protein [Terrisporobacter othiniensis]